MLATLHVSKTASSPGASIMHDISVKEAVGWASDPVVPDFSLPSSTLATPKDPLEAIQESLREIRDLQRALLERLPGAAAAPSQPEAKPEPSKTAAEYEALRHHLEHLRYERDLRPNRSPMDFASWGLWGMVAALFLGPLLLFMLLSAVKF